MTESRSTNWEASVESLCVLKMIGMYKNGDEGRIMRLVGGAPQVARVEEVGVQRNTRQSSQEE